MIDNNICGRLDHIAKHVTAMTYEVKVTCCDASALILKLVVNNKLLRETLEAVDSEIALDGQIKKLVDVALACGQKP